MAKIDVVEGTTQHCRILIRDMYSPLKIIFTNQNGDDLQMSLSRKQQQPTKTNCDKHYINPG